MILVGFVGQALILLPGLGLGCTDSILVGARPYSLINEVCRFLDGISLGETPEGSWTPLVRGTTVALR